jgi:hypothetical protein
VALKPLNHKVRDRVLQILKSHAEEACQRFSQLASNTVCEEKHRWALVNLALLSCDTYAVRKVILEGLYHPSKKIQEAAALSIGLFDDPDYLKAVTDFMERDRFLFVKDCG